MPSALISIISGWLLKSEVAAMISIICRWPLDKEKCGETRCLTCAPAIMAASQVFALISPKFFFFEPWLEKLLTVGLASCFTATYVIKIAGSFSWRCQWYELIGLQNILQKKTLLPEGLFRSYSLSSIVISVVLLRPKGPVLAFFGSQGPKAENGKILTFYIQPVRSIMPPWTPSRPI